MINAIENRWGCWMIIIIRVDDEWSEKNREKKTEWNLICGQLNRIVSVSVMSGENECGRKWWVGIIRWSLALMKARERRTTGQKKNPSLFALWLSRTVRYAIKSLSLNWIKRFVSLRSFPRNFQNDGMYKLLRDHSSRNEIVLFRLFFVESTTNPNRLSSLNMQQSISHFWTNPARPPFRPCVMNY